MIYKNLTDWTVCGYHQCVPIFARSVETDYMNKGVTYDIPAKVPGSIYKDLYRAGYIEDYLTDMNSVKCEWVSQRWWKYKTSVDIVKDGSRLELVFEGIDCRSRIYFNGEQIGASNNMFVPFICDITDLAVNGSNEIEVIIEHAPDEQGQIGYTSKTTTQKSRFNYKWDFTARMISMGLFRPVYIKSYELCKLGYWYFSPEGVDGRATLTAEVIGQSEGCVAVAEIGGKTYSAEVKNGSVQLDVFVENAQPWFPNGSGAQPLYDLTLTVRKGDKICDSFAKKVAFKKFELRKNDDAPFDAFGYVFTVNGKELYVKGVNLTPLDITCHAEEERYDELLSLLKDANINVIRVWGGGVIESEHFYELCDQMGFMVWQEFIQSSSGIDNVPSKHPEFLLEHKRTAEHATKTLRNHVSLCMWSGGNELTDENKVPITFSDGNIAMIKEVADRNSPHVIMLPSSASGPFEHAKVENNGRNHDVHGPWQFCGEKYHYEFYNDIDSLFYSEFGVDGMSSLESLKRFLTPDHLKVTNILDDLVWRHHGEWWDTTERDKLIFGPTDSLEKLIERSQFIQGEGLRYALESNRRKAFRNSGSIIWQANELYPNVFSTALIDYYLKPKKAYFCAKKAFSSINASLKYSKLVWEKGEKFFAELYVVSDHERQVTECKFTASCGGRLVAEGSLSAECGGGRAVKLCDMTFEVPDASYIEIKLCAKNDDGEYENTVKLLIRGENGYCSDEDLE